MYFVESEQQRRWSDCVDAQAGLCFGCSSRDSFMVKEPNVCDYVMYIIVLCDQRSL